MNWQRHPVRFAGPEPLLKVAEFRTVSPTDLGPCSLNDWMEQALDLHTTSELAMKMIIDVCTLHFLTSAWKSDRSPLPRICYRMVTRSLR
jgi:hypothetical protein